MRRIIISGTGSGCGKTTIVCALLTALCKRGIRTASFKCGPDYIDPMFHKKAIGTDSCNLDSFFCDDATLCYLLNENSRHADISVIEGVMGYYDGNADGRGSAHSVSQVTDTGAIIVIDCKGMGNSIGAVMKGFLTYREPSRIIGFLFNRLPSVMEASVRAMCCELGTEYLGSMPLNAAVFESRHLGLVTADEIDGIKEKLSRLGELAETHIAIDRILQLSGNHALHSVPPEIRKISSNRKPVIAVARDAAFCFIYKENIALLEKMGCEISYFSPLQDKGLPRNADGLILYGGYPELYAETLWKNQAMRQSIQAAVKSGMPLIAECGGFLYLHTMMENSEKNKFEMVDIIQGTAYKTERLQRFGYITMTAERDSLLAKKGDTIKAHEFHYWDSTNCGDGFTAVKSNGKQWQCGVVSETMYCGFPHIYFYGNLTAAKRFAEKCAEYRRWKHETN